MMAKSDAFSIAYDDYVRALKLDPTDAATLEGFARTAILTNQAQDGLSWVKSLTVDRPTVHAQVATSKLLAAAGLKSDAVDAAQQACGAEPPPPAACEQLASLHADAGDRASLEPVVQTLRQVAPDAAATHYYSAALAFMGGNAQEALDHAQRAIGVDAKYAAAYDMAGAAHTKLDQADLARQAFQTSLQFDPHDSTAYTNLGLIALAAGRTDEAVDYFAEALWLTPNSQAARDGLQRARGR
jgi:Flp pilus assembly protein TadD